MTKLEAPMAVPPPGTPHSLMIRPFRHSSLVIRAFLSHYSFVISHFPSPRAPPAIDIRSSPPTLRPVNPAPKLETTKDKTAALKATFELINAQLYSVEERIRQQARAFHPAVEGYVAY